MLRLFTPEVVCWDEKWWGSMALSNNNHHYNKKFWPGKGEGLKRVCAGRQLRAMAFVLIAIC